MKTVLCILVLSLTCFAQYSAEYDGERLIALYDLTEPVNCGLMQFAGPIKEIQTPANSSIAYFVVKAGRYERDVELDLSPLSQVDRSNLFYFILRPGRRVQITGYACGSNGVVDPVSIRESRR